MKARIQIPAGWRRLRAGEIIAKGDRYCTADKCFLDASTSNAEWRAWEHHIGAPFNPCWGISIRRVKRRAKAQWVEVDYVEWQRCCVVHCDDFRMSDKTGKKLMTFAEWQHCPLTTWETRFWLRRGAK
jgi:hypothetical protein